LIVNLGQSAWRFSGLGDAVFFDIDADGKPDRIGWTERDSDLAFITLDRNGNGRIDDGTELFGDHTPLANGSPAANGFAALSELDVNRDGIVDASDPVWQRLSLWVDANRKRASCDRFVAVTSRASAPTISGPVERIRTGTRFD
jgi:hypothetical protein